jgi:hypothetical protein
MEKQRRLNYSPEDLATGGIAGEIKPYDFDECIKFSHSVADLPFWECAYRAFFRDFQAMHGHRDDGIHQRQGIDRSVILTNGKQYTIDEKARGRNRKTGRVYTDIALEFWSDKEKRIKGWVVKSLWCDYIAYAIVPLGKVYLLPTNALQMAWRNNAIAWVREFGRREVANKSWTTVFCPVPARLVFKAVGNALRYNFEPIELMEDGQTNETRNDLLGRLADSRPDR